MDRKPTQSFAVDIYSLGACGNRRRLHILYMQLSVTIPKRINHHYRTCGGIAHGFVTSTKTSQHTP